MKTNIYKLGSYRDANEKSPPVDEVRHVYPDTFETESTTGAPRLRIGCSGSPIPVIASLAELLSPPFIVLLVLKVSRCNNKQGRYQSPALERRELDDIFAEFGEFFGSDARLHFWVHSPDDRATIVLDDHNIVYGYGPLDDFRKTLSEQGFRPGPVVIPVPHCQHYNAEFDKQERQIVKRYSWKVTPLQEDDED